MDQIKGPQSKPLRRATLVFLIRENKVLLAMKKRGFGMGKWNGVGGKVKPGETIKQAARRETTEEIGVIPKSLGQMATLNFYFPTVPLSYDWNQQVTVYLVDKWSGEPRESEEMCPMWFAKDDLPYNFMWPDDQYWLPRVLSGKKVAAEFVFDDDSKIKSYKFFKSLTGKWR